MEPIINSHPGCWITQRDWAVSALDKSSPLCHGWRPPQF